MVGLRIPVCLAIVVAGCGSPELQVDVAASALNSCNAASDCFTPAVGTCVKAVCTMNACDAADDKTPVGCAAGCTVDTQCAIPGACFTPTCNVAMGTCNFTVPAGNTTCDCKVDGDCAATPPSPTCQQSAQVCRLGRCVYPAKTAPGCCNSATNCNTMGTAATCNTTNNTCVCASGRYCATGPSGCVTGNECCQDSDCGAGNTCNGGTCTCGGTEKHCPNIGCIAATGCCGDSDCTTPATCNGSHVCVCASLSTPKYCAGVGCIAATGCCGNSDCSGAATCDPSSHTCGCAVNQRYCAGVGCVPSTGCCAPADCAPRANATVACTANACVYTCNANFHNCSNVCKADSDVDACGSACTVCPAGNACQSATCTAGACGLTGAGASPCCNQTSDCAPANGCQAATACTNNMCVFGSSGAAGCCNRATDCTPPTEPCLTATCVANQCATAPVAGCSDDGGVTPMPDDLSTPIETPPDLSAAISLSGGGGCAVAGGRDGARAPALLVVLALVALGLRRRDA